MFLLGESKLQTTCLCDDAACKFSSGTESVFKVAQILPYNWVRSHILADDILKRVHMEIHMEIPNQTIFYRKGESS